MRKRRKRVKIQRNILSQLSGVNDRELSKLVDYLKQRDFIITHVEPDDGEYPEPEYEPGPWWIIHYGRQKTRSAELR